MSDHKIDINEEPPVLIDDSDNLGSKPSSSKNRPSSVQKVKPQSIKNDATGSNSMRDSVKNIPPKSRGNSFTAKSQKDSVKSRSGRHSVSRNRSSTRNSKCQSDSDLDNSDPDNCSNNEEVLFPSGDRSVKARHLGTHSNRRSSQFRSRRQTRFIEGDETNQESELNEESEDEYGMTLKDRQEYLNVFHPFGLPLWKPALYKKSRSVTRNARSALHSVPTSALSLTFGNAVWFLLFGWWLSFIIYTASIFLLFIPYGGKEYSGILQGLGWYLFWPFNKYVEKIHGDISLPYANSDEEPLLGSEATPKVQNNLPGKIAYYIVFYFVVAPILLFTSLINWLMVFSVPMAKLNFVMVKKLRRIPLQLRFRKGSAMGTEDPIPHPSLCAKYAFGFGYYKYTYDGINIMFINLLSVVFFTLADAYIISPLTDGKAPIAAQSVIFGCCLISTMPLAYFIGMAVSSISAQSSLGMGAVINATFGSIVEIILYCLALTEGKANLVEGSIIGSMLAGLLLMPGFSMIGGAIKKKQQRFNAKSAGVTSTMLIMSVIGVFITTLFYSTYATFELRCGDCPDPQKNENWTCKDCNYYQPHPADSKFYYEHARPLMYICAILLPLAYVVCLFFTLRTHTKIIYSPPTNPSRALQNIYKSLLPNYILQQLHLNESNNQDSNNGIQEQDVSGGIEDGASPSADSHRIPVVTEEEAANFSGVEQLDPIPLSVHQSLLDGTVLTHEQNQSILKHAQDLFKGDDEDDEEETVGHDAPEWSKTKSAVILCACTVLFSLIAELMVKSVDVVVEGLHIREKILGLTLFALVPNVTEFVNAISFAIHGNISLSMEIGSAYTVQVALLQIPALVAFTAYYHWSSALDPSSQSFTLVFPRMDMFSVLFSVFLITYIYIEGKSNYFKGMILVLTYIIWLSAFILEPPLSELPGLISMSQLHRVYV